jgi:hypothetical protein
MLDEEGQLEEVAEAPEATTPQYVEHYPQRMVIDGARYEIGMDLMRAMVFDADGRNALSHPWFNGKSRHKESPAHNKKWMNEAMGFLNGNQEIDSATIGQFLFDRIIALRNERDGDLIIEDVLLMLQALLGLSETQFKKLRLTKDLQEGVAAPSVLVALMCTFIHRVFYDPAGSYPVEDFSSDIMPELSALVDFFRKN